MKMVITFLFVAVLVGGCTDRISYNHKKFCGSALVEETSVVYSKGLGNSDREAIEAIIGEARLTIGKSAVDMDKVMEAWISTADLLKEALEQYMKIN